MNLLPALAAGALQRAHIVRSVAEVLSTEAPLSQLWERCGVLLASLVHGDSVEVTLVRKDGAGKLPAAGSLAASVLETGETLVRAGDDGRATVGVPIAFGEVLYGALVIDGLSSVDPEQTALLESCALYLGARIRYEQHMPTSERFAQLAYTDGLTGIANRRQFDETFAREWARALRESATLSMLMLDIDHFHSFNETYGFVAGDACLQRVATALQSCVKRPADIIARYGGAEFVVLLPGTQVSGATTLAEEMRAAIADLAIEHDGSTLGRLSVSMGVASEVPSPNVDAQTLVQTAEGALYRAKLSGRNRVHAHDYRTDSETARARRTSAHNNLPAALSRMVGRKAEVAHARGLMDKHRLVSIVGAGGTGKTRVAIAVAGKAAGRFADGAWFVDLSPISDKTLVASSIAAAFSAEVSMDESAADALAVILESKDALLVIDNCEHVVADVANLAVALLRHCQRLSILTTSREPLGIAGEAVYRLPLLSMPDTVEDLTASQALAYDAIALFVERVTEAKRDFELTHENLQRVFAICRAVDGIALAIELAASRAGLSSLDDVEVRLTEFRLLSGGHRTALPRQRTMHAMIGWSFALLSEEERTLFRRLSMFAGGFTFDAVAEICSGGLVDTEAVFDLLSGLIRKSMVSDDPGYEGRYRLLDSMRAFAHECLLEAGETERLSHWHAEYYESLARQADEMYSKTPSREWLQALEPDVDNFRAAMEWALDRRGDVILGAALAAATMNFFNDYMPSEATRWILKALDTLPPGAAAQIEAQLCRGLTTTARSLPAERLRAAGERAVELCRSMGDARSLSEALRGLAQIMGWYFRPEREIADALACESIDIARKLGDPVQLAMALRTRGLTLDTSDFPRKRATLEESLALMREHGNDRQIGGMLTWISEMEFSAGDKERALEYGREAVRVAESSGSNELYTGTTANLANYASSLGDWETVRSAAAETIRVSRKTRRHDSLTFAIQALAVLAASEADYARAAQLIGFCDARCGALHPQRQADQSDELVYRSLMQLLNRRLDEETLAREMKNGAAMNEEEAVRLAGGSKSSDPTL